MRSRYLPRFEPGQVITVAVIVLLVPLLATANAVAGPYSALPYVALAAFLAFTALPLNYLVLGCFVAGSVLAGLIEYFTKINQVFWLPFMMGVLFAMRALAERMRLGTVARTHATFPSQRLAPAPHPVIWIAAVYFAIAIFGLAVAMPPLPQVVVAFKNYFFLWGLLLVLLWSPWSIDQSRGFWTTVLVVACIQWPLVLYQRFVVTAHRSDSTAWDAVVGTFGGSPEAGGHSSTMAFVCCLAIGVVLLRMQARRVGPVSGSVLVALCLVPIALGEVKSAFIWLFVVFLIVFARQSARKPFRTVLSLLIAAALLGALGMIYMTTYREKMGSTASVQDVFDKQVKYAFDPNNFSVRDNRLGRMATFVFWWERHDLRGDPMHFLVGHGLGASRSASSLGVGELATKLPYEVDVTAASTLLWDTGLLGALSFTGMLVAAALGALRVSMRPELTPLWRESTVLASCVLVMAVFGVLYNNDPISSAAIQTLIFFAIAQLILARRQVVALSAAPAPGSVRANSDWSGRLASAGLPRR